MAEPARNSSQPLNELFPSDSRVLLTVEGRRFIERLGVEAARQAIVAILSGENVRNQTEPLTRRRLSQISGALLVMFAQGYLANEAFGEQLSSLAVEQIRNANKSDSASVSLAQWVIGITGKSTQNVLRDNPDTMQKYLDDFDAALDDSVAALQRDIGEFSLTFGFAQHADGRKATLGWKDILRLTTAIGSQTLTIRGSDKSMYGKLFERLVLGSVLTLFGFQRVDRTTNRKSDNVFWLSDATRNRESDATLIYRPGSIARFDIGFIGPGNPEIAKDKLSRYERELEMQGIQSDSTTFIIVDRLSGSRATQEAAQRVGAEIVEMSMKYWPKELAIKLGERLGFTHELQQMPNDQIHSYLHDKLENIRVQDFLIGVAATSLEPESNDVSIIGEEIT